MDWDAFFEVHKDLPREGPGTASDVGWALELAALPEGAAICDAGAGAGGDVAALSGAGRVLAVDLQEGFVTQMQARFADLPAVTVRRADMAGIADFPEAPFDLIWCAGALYFLGLEDGLATLRAGLKPGGVLAFSEPCYFTDTPGEAARAFWEGYPTRDAGGILSAVSAAGFEVLGSRPVPDAGWEAYYQPMEARIADLRPGASPSLTGVLDLCAQEARDWRAVREQTGYLLTVARRT
ncbi:class I SAM-dependent methyltransferase [Mameliella alba]|nr:class I SAM-dependent methyltransferase [Antarctobacter heliothermus]MBY6145587.1 class I SAM-dependent methyltransferase [Mameliella alba]MBY6160911.1 class I SAM-dependent methyltransferase [Mameliella alba]MBY6169381.1 class I SAM-dependent methyltransferase [Mameliella alba]MBY6174400.1 class I SAM-dependent methyltransferase [Mameliella alba]